MKKLIAVILTIVLIACSVSVASVASEEKDYPLVVVPGYSSSYLYAVEDGNQRQLWGSLEGLNIVDVVLSNIAQIGIGLGAAAFGQPDYLVNTVIDALREVLGDLACNPDGSPVVETVTYPNDPAITNYTYLIEQMGSMHAAEIEIMNDISEKYGENGFDNIFSFQCDFRKNVIDVADDLKAYIDSVLVYTGADKVNIYAVSYGGQISATYLNLYGAEGKVNNAVLTVPAIGGAALAYDAISENIHLDEETLLRFIENGMMIEEDINWLMKAHSLGFLDTILNKLLHNGGRKLFDYWGSIWDFIPAEYYEDMKNTYLDPVESAPLIAKSDMFHNEILPSMSEKFNDCINNGTNIYIVAGTDNPSVTGLCVQSDAIIHVNGATGADCAPFGLRFPDGYTGKKTNCDDVKHNHMAPAMNIDASTCYLPEQTWFISGLFHGMTWKDAYVRQLCTNLLFADAPVDVHTYKEFPQFMYATNVCYSVKAYFDCSDDGYWSDNDNVLIVKNLSEKYKMILISVDCYGVDIKFDLSSPVVLQPGESIDITYSGNLPSDSYLTADIYCNYNLVGSITPQGVRCQTFTVMNGEPVEITDSSAYVSANHSTAFDDASEGFIGRFMKVLGVFDFFKMMLNMLFSLLNF